MKKTIAHPTVLILFRERSFQIESPYQMQKRYVSLKLYIRILLLVFCCVTSVNAVDSFIFSVNKIKADDWSLNNAVLTLKNLNQTSPHLSLLSATLLLPPPLETITALKIRCQHFLWSENYINCEHGKVRFNSNHFNIPELDFSFQFKDSKSNFKISELPIFGGKITISAQELSGKWHVLIKAKHVNLVELAAFFALDGIAIKRGYVDLEMQIEGEQSNIQDIVISALLKSLSVEDTQGHFASDGALVSVAFKALRQNADWQWQNKLRLQQGGLYMEPVYLEIERKNTVTLSANGVWLAEQQMIQIDRFKLEHPLAMMVQGNAILSHKTGLSIDLANLLIDMPQLKSATPIYLLPFLESSVFDGIELAGNVNATLTLKLDELTDASININNLKIDDTQQRFHLNQVNAQLNWTKQQKNPQISFINWQSLKLHTIPFQSGQIEFTSFANKIELLNQANLKVLGGTLSINDFSFTSMENNAGASIGFEGSINKLSLEQLSKTLGWTPLTGTISGYIPSVHYQDRTLLLDGELKIQVFSGEIRMNNLASSGMFTDFSQFYADIEFDDLDLAAMTQKFYTGYIEGRLSGSVQNLYLENWQPVSFYAWMGTPDNDNSSHRISQKAVENIASIGGGNISDVLSRGFLGLFSTFDYSRLGFGCYLYQGVCQLMGLEAVDNGFYLIKGGGLPKINVIGYNPRLNWNELLTRLSRVTATDKAIVE